MEDDGNVLTLDDGGGGYTTLYIYLKLLTCILVMCGFMVYKLYLTKDERKDNDCFKIIIMVLQEKEAKNDQVTMDMGRK